MFHAMSRRTVTCSNGSPSIDVPTSTDIGTTNRSEVEVETEQIGQTLTSTWQTKSKTAEGDTCTDTEDVIEGGG